MSQGFLEELVSTCVQHLGTQEAGAKGAGRSHSEGTHAQGLRKPQVSCFRASTDSRTPLPML
jgi:hypothetical protein